VASGALHRRRCCLIVEDNLARVTRLYRLAAAIDWDVATATTLAEGRRKIDGSFEERYDALLVDLGLPDGSGFAIIESAKARVPHVPIPVVSGSSDRADISRAQALGAFYRPWDDYESNAVQELGVQKFLRQCEGGPVQAAIEAFAQEVVLSRMQHDIVFWATLQTSDQTLLAERLCEPIGAFQVYVADLLAHSRRIYPELRTLEDLAATLRARAYRLPPVSPVQRDATVLALASEKTSEKVSDDPDPAPVSLEAPSSPRVDEEVTALARRYGLSPTLQRVVKGAIEVSTSRDLLAEALGLGAQTVKTHVASVLGAVGTPTFEELIATLRARVFRREWRRRKKKPREDA
jgi:DNA-binding NarL/FixJ family response regulator